MAHRRRLLIEASAANEPWATNGSPVNPSRKTPRPFIRYAAIRGNYRLGRRHLDYLLSEFTSYYNTKRSHVEQDHLPAAWDVLDEVEVKEHIAEPAKSFEQRGARHVSEL